MNKFKSIDYVKVILCLVVAATFVGLLYNHREEIKRYLNNFDVSDQSDATKFKIEYEQFNSATNSAGKPYPVLEISGENIVKYSNSYGALDILKGGTGVIYFGYASCPWCRNAVPVLLDAAYDSGIDNIYYVDITFERDKYIYSNGELFLEEPPTQGYLELLEVLDEYLDEYTIKDDNGNDIETGEKRIYVPLVVFVRDGKIVGIHADTVESQKDPYVVLDDKQREELYNIYMDNFHKVLNDLCDERC